MPTGAGHNATVSYLWEDDGTGNPDFATDSPEDSTYKTFGADVNVNTLEGSNNAVRVFNPASREAARIVEQNFEGSWGVEFNFTNPWWLGGLLDYDVESSGTDPTTHDWDGDVPYSMRLLVGNQQSDEQRYLKGCVIASGTISVDTGGMVSVSLEGAYADEDPIDSNMVTQPTIRSGIKPLHFGQANINRGGDNLSLAQNLSLSIENNTDLIPELGTRFPVDYSPKQRTADLNYTRIVTDEEDTKRMYGSGNAPEETVDNTEDIVLSFDNGESGNAMNTLTLTLDNVFPNSAERSGVGDPEADLEDALTEMAPTLSATAQNGVNTSP